MEQNINRHEIKYSISTFEARLLRSRLPALLTPDKHAGPDGSYFIRSVYFDDPYYTAYNEKLSGVKERTKYRIRFYNNKDDVVFLEKKSKDGDFCGKEAVRISREQAEQFLKGSADLVKLPGLAGELGRLRQGGYAPVVIVDYNRYAFTYPTENVRVTIDTDVRTAPYQIDIFSSRLLTIPVLDPGEEILEVKYDAFLPAGVRALLEGVPKQRCAMSKYTKCLGMIE